MEQNEDRRKKLEAGKEKLAAFRKKKAKQKKIESDNQLPSKKIIEPLEDESFHQPEISNWNDVYSTEGDSDQFFISTDDEFSTEEQESLSSDYQQGMPSDAQHISEFKGNVEDKLLTPDSMESELNGAQKTELKGTTDIDTNESNDLMYCDLEKALTQRDTLIAQLTESLQSNANAPSEGSDMLQQIHTLSVQVSHLQNQLHQTNQTMQEQMLVHDISSSVLQGAKTQMLQLQNIVKDKDDDLQSSQARIQHLQRENEDLHHHLSVKNQELNNLSKKVEDSNHLNDLHNQWLQQEKTLQDELTSRSGEIEGLKEIDQQNKALITELTHSGRYKDEELQKLAEELEGLKRMKADMENESQSLIEENRELTAYSQNISASLSNHTVLTADFDKLSKAHNDLEGEHESLKSKCLHLENVIDELKQENSASKCKLENLNAQLEEEQQKYIQQEKMLLDMESRQSIYSDQLNNKLNDLQNRLSTSEEALSQAEKNLNDERQQCKNLQEQLSAEKSLLIGKCKELEEQAKSHSEVFTEIQMKEQKIAEMERLTQEYRNMIETLQDKDQNLEIEKDNIIRKSTDLERQLDELKAENGRLTEQAGQLMGDLLSIQQVHSDELSERDSKEKDIEEQMEVINEDLNAAIKRTAELESQLKERDDNLLTQNDKRKHLEVQLTTLELERDALRETVQSLNADIGRLKEELTIEMKAPVEEKILAYENKQLSASLNKDENVTEEKSQMAILEGEIQSWKTKFDEKENICQDLEENIQKCRSEYNEEIKHYKCDIAQFKQDLKCQSEQNDHLRMELTELKSALERSNDEVRRLLESQKVMQEELQEIKEEKKVLEVKYVEASSRIKQFEGEIEALKTSLQDLQHKEKEQLQYQGALECQLQASIGEKEKLQEIIREKEVQLQNAQDAMEEMKRNVNILESSHMNELSNLQTNMVTWMEKNKESELTVNELQAQLSQEKNALNFKEKELSETIKTFGEKEAIIQNLEVKLSALDTEVGKMSEENGKYKEEISQLSATLEKTQGELRTAEAEIEGIKEEYSEEKEYLRDRLNSYEKEMINAAQHKKEIELSAQNLNAQLESKQSQIEDLTCTLENLHLSKTDLESKCLETNNLLAEEQQTKSHLQDSLNRMNLEGLRLKGLVAFLTENHQEKDDVILKQNISLIEKDDQISDLKECKSETDKAVKTLEESNLSLFEANRQMERDKDVLHNEKQFFSEEVQRLSNEVATHEQGLSQLSLDKKRLADEIKKIKDGAEGMNSVIQNLKRDCEIHENEICSLKSDIEEKDSRIQDITSELENLHDAVQTRDEEKKLLKMNFDACMEDMQQKSADQDAELHRMKSQLAEESKNISQSHIDMKEMYEQQLSQLEDRLLCTEKDREKSEKEGKELHENMDALKESYENQMSELELSLQAANAECVKLNDCLAKANANYENEIQNLRALHEMQRSEVLDNNISLEKMVAELQKNYNENSERAKMEREDLEQSFEAQMLELDEKRRYSESEVSRLKRHLDEMKKDHEIDIDNLEKRYETQLFEMEDKCTVMSAELDRARKSMMSIEGDFGEERKGLEIKVDDLENIRRELEIKVSILDDDLSNLKEQSQRREEEMKSVLQNAAERQRNLQSEADHLKEELSQLNADKDTSMDSVKKTYDDIIKDLEKKNKHLEEQVSSLLKNAEEDMAFMSRGKDSSSLKEEKTDPKICELKEQIAFLSEENLSLKRHLLSHKGSEKKNIMSAGVEDICPYHQSELEMPHSLPKLKTSTPSKSFEKEDSFSPTVEEVSMIEGFVAERDQSLFSCRMDSLNSQPADEDRVGEPDFVAEKQDHFQPEMVIEKVISSETEGRQLSIHPIREEAITDGFQPEVGDQFLMETIEEPDGVFISNLSVGLSPSMQEKRQFQFDNIPATENVEPQVFQAPSSQASDPCDNFSTNRAHEGSAQVEEATFTSSELARKLANLKETLEEEYITQMRTQKRDLVVEYETKKEDYQREMELHFSQKAQSIKNEWEQKFAKALQKVRKDVEKRHLKDLRQTRKGQHRKIAANNSHEEQEILNQSEEGMPDILEGSEELDQRVQQLSRENQELAEARDELLKQIEISQTRGLHHQVQHELHSKITGRGSPESSISPSPTKTLTSESPAVEEVISPTHTLTSTSPAHENEEGFTLPADEGSESNMLTERPSPDSASSEADSSHTEISETSSARDRFLEEFADISQQSSQDLPLEWELTTTIADAGEFEPNPQHGSVWEVFDGRCMRQDCQEVRQRYHRLSRFLVKCNFEWEDLLSEESGLLMPGFFDNIDENDTPVNKQNVELTDRSLGDSINETNAANASILNAVLRLAKEQLEEEISIEQLKRQLYETLQDNHSLKIKLAREYNRREQFERKKEVSSDQNSSSEKIESHIGVQVELSGSKRIVNDEFDHSDNQSTNKCRNCYQNIQSLNLSLLEKEQALMKLQFEISELKSHKSENVKFEELESLKKEVQFKDKVIKNLHEDLNRLIYPKLLPSDDKDISLLQDESKFEKNPFYQQDLNLFISPTVLVNAEDQYIDKIDKDRLAESLSQHLHEIPCEVKMLNYQKYSSVSLDDGEVVKTECSIELSPESMGGYEQEIAAGEGLAFVTQQDIEIATKQSLTLNHDEGEAEKSAAVIDKVMKWEALEEKVLVEPEMSSSSSSTLPSAFSTPKSSSGKGTPSVLQDKILAEELDKLKKDVQETKAIYSKENSLLQEALQKDKIAKEFEGSLKLDLHLDSSRLTFDRSESLANSPLSKDEVTTLEQRLTICLEQNRMLEEENTSLRARIREQDAIVVIVKQKLQEKERSSEEWRKSMNHQLKSLQHQRDNLLQLLRNLEDGTSPSLSETMGQAAVNEESLRQAQEDLMEKIEELDHLHQMLTQRQIELQHCEAERRHLEQLCLLKDQTEMQLMRQKRLMEEQVMEIELRLRERETTLVDEKTRLIRELREKDQHLSQMSQSARCSPTPTIVVPRSSSIGDLNTGLLETLNAAKRHNTSCLSSTSSVEDVDKQHTLAVEKLREKLKLEYELKAARVAESQALAISSYWERHGNISNSS